MAAIRLHKDSSANGWPIIPACGSSFITGGTRRKFGHRCRRSIPSPHASWMENFPWTRLANIEMPRQQKPMSDVEKLRRIDPKSLREYLKDGNYGGLYQREDKEMMKIWRTGVEETRALLGEAWD